MSDPFNGKDPFTAIYNALWAKLEASTEVTSQVQPANRIKVADQLDVDAWKKNVQGGDLPELYLGPVGGGISQLTSSSHGGTLRFVLAVSTGSLQVDHELNPVLWACLRAMYANGRRLDLQYVKDVRFTDILSQPEDLASQVGEPQRETRGWASLVTIDVDVMFRMDAALRPSIETG